MSNDPDGGGPEWAEAPLCLLVALAGLAAVAGCLYAGCLTWGVALLIAVCTIVGFAVVVRTFGKPPGAPALDPRTPDWDVWDESKNDPAEAGKRVVHAESAEAAAELFASLCEPPACPGDPGDPLFSARVGVRAKCPGAPTMVYDVWRSGRGLACRLVAIR